MAPRSPICFRSISDPIRDNFSLEPHPRELDRLLHGPDRAQAALVVMHPARCDISRKQNGHDVSGNHSQNHCGIHEQHLTPSNHITHAAVVWFQENVEAARGQATLGATYSPQLPRP